MIFVYIYIYIYIYPPPCRRHARACLGCCLVAWRSYCLSACFEGLTAFFPNCSGLGPCLFFTLFFTWQFVSKLMKNVSPKSLKIWIFRKKSVEKHAHAQDLGKVLVSNEWNLWNWQRLHTFSCFSRGSVPPKINKMEAWMERLGALNHKKYRH